MRRPPFNLIPLLEREEGEAEKAITSRWLYQFRDTSLQWRALPTKSLLNVHCARDNRTVEGSDEGRKRVKK